MRILATPFSLLLSALYTALGRYWLAIVILSVIVRLCMYPIYKKQILSTAGMTDIQPKVKEIQRKYANDKETMNQKIAELYKAENFNPAAGCLPMVIQLVVIGGLFALLRYPLNYLDDTMVFAVHELFLWIKDLSQPDQWILLIASGIATFFAFSMNQQTNAQAPGMGAGMGIMKFLFPLMIVLLAKTYPAGLAIYWFISQVTQVFFNLRFNKLRKDMQK